MPAKDLYHDTVCAALIKDGWTITDDPLILKIGGRLVFVDLGAEKLIAAERGAEKIAVEIRGDYPMEAVNQPLDQWRETLENILQYYANLPYRYGDVSTYVLVSRDCNHFMLMHEGWEQNRRVHGCVVHTEIRNDKIWIHYDGIKDGITGELVAAGVPKDHIVLAFHPPQVRSHTGYVLA